MLQPKDFDNVAPSMGVILNCFEQFVDQKDWIARPENRSAVLAALKQLGGKVGSFSDMNMALAIIKGVGLCAILATHLEDGKALYDFVLQVVSAEQESIGVPILRPDEQRILDTFYSANNLLQAARSAAQPKESYVEPEYLKEGGGQLAERLHEEGRQVSLQTNHLWPEEGTSWSESTAKWKTLLMVVSKNLLEKSSAIHQGMHSRRLKNESEEKRFARAWARENSFQDIASLLLHQPKHGRSTEKATPREAQIVASTIQWLGSNVGRSFLYELGYRKQD